MSFAVGVFDVFAYTVPGALYLVGLLYLAIRLGHLPPEVFLSSGPLASLTLGAIASFFLGHVTYGLGAVANERLPGGMQWGDASVKDHYLRRCPEAKGRPFVEANSWLLLSKIQLISLDAANDVARLRSMGLMLRHSAPPLAGITVLFLVEFIVGGDRRFFFAVFVILSLLASIAALRQGRRSAPGLE